MNSFMSATLMLWEPAWTKMTLSMLIAILCGGAIGLERSRRGRQAGFRTYAIVSLAACSLVAAISQESGSFSLGDPASRVIQGLLTGVGFLGAGVIVKDGLNIKGLTTAASIWLTSAIGVLAGFGMGALAIVTTGLSLLILTFFRIIEEWVASDHYIQIALTSLPQEPISEAEVHRILGGVGMRVVEIAYAKKNNKAVITVAAVYQDKNAPNLLAKHLFDQEEKITGFEISASPES